MLLFILAYLGGVLTILSPCILPVLPFVFARAGRPFLTNGLPMLIGMALMFMIVASLAAVGGGWAVEANQYGRAIALALLAVFGLVLLFPAFADRLMRPLVAFGARLSQRADTQGSGFWPSLLLGVATGLLWAPCAGPILGLVLTGAALQGASAGTSLLLLAYALGSATSLGLALVVGGRLYTAMTRSLRIGEWVRRAGGAAVLIAVAAIATGLDTGFLTRASLAGTNRIEQGLLDRVQGPRSSTQTASVLGDEGAMPPLDGAIAWLNSPPLSREELRGKVVLVDFWTYSCINCLRALPYVKAWSQKYRKDGLVVIGVHAPEFAFEKDVANVRKAVADLGIDYPVAIDNNYAIWRAFDNHYWPAHYFIDAKGRIRHHHFGEGDYAGSERIIQMLLAEADGATLSPQDTVTIEGRGIEAAPGADIQSPETYIGYDRSQRWASRPAVSPDRLTHYSADPKSLNEWGLAGVWTVGAEAAVAAEPGARIVYRFHARDLHLVLSPNSAGHPVRFRVTIDGAPPGDDHGVDTDSNGNGVVSEERLYQLVRQEGPVRERVFEVEFLDPGVQAFSFTFG